MSQVLSFQRLLLLSEHDQVLTVQGHLVCPVLPGPDLPLQLRLDAGQLGLEVTPRGRKESNAESVPARVAELGSYQNWGVRMYYSREL